MNNLLLKYIYTAFLGILIVAFVGLGIETFYPRPDYPEYPIELSEYYRDCGNKTDCTLEAMPDYIRELEDAYENATREFQPVVATYSRNVSLVSLGLSIVILAISLMFVEKLGILSDGVLVGGMFTLGYGILLGFESDDPQFRFLMVTVGLVVAIVLGYLKFVKPHADTGVPVN